MTRVEEEKMVEQMQQSVDTIVQNMTEENVVYMKNKLLVKLFQANKIIQEGGITKQDMQGICLSGIVQGAKIARRPLTTFDRVFALGTEMVSYPKSEQSTILTRAILEAFQQSELGADQSVRVLKLMQEMKRAPEHRQLAFDLLQKINETAPESVSVAQTTLAVVQELNYKRILNSQGVQGNMIRLYKTIESHHPGMVATELEALQKMGFIDETIPVKKEWDLVPDSARRRSIPWLRRYSKKR